jgi:hypothetical protein
MNKHSSLEIMEQLKKQPIRTAHRILQEFGENTENIIEHSNIGYTEKQELLFNVREERKHFETKNWNKGYVRRF